MSQRICNKCHHKRPISQFQIGRRTCNGCRSIERGELRRGDPLRELCTNAAHRARDKGFECNVTSEYLRTVLAAQDGLCFFFKVPLHIDGTSADSLFQVSLDRLDNSRGYVEGNVALTCMAANLARNKYTAEEFAKFCEALPAFLATRPRHTIECLMRKLADPRPILVTGDLDVVSKLRLEMRKAGKIGPLLFSHGIASFVMHLSSDRADMFFQSLRERGCIRAMALDVQGVVHA